ncbi:MAG: ATP-binding protein [Bryobacteraceae bacterium]
MGGHTAEPGQARLGTRPERTRFALIAAGIVLASAGHYLTPPDVLLWHNIFQRLYYLPIVLAGITFGWVGGLAVAACSSICYIPHIIMAWQDNVDYRANQFAELVVFFLVGGVTGLLADRERKQRFELQQTAEELGRVYRDLQNSFEQLKRADRMSAVGQLASGLAHEIRNPLASIAGAIDILERNPGQEDRAFEFFGIIKKECDRLNRLLTSLLDFARPRQPEIGKVEPVCVIGSVANLVRHSAEQQNVVLREDIPSGLASVEGDSEQIEQVILNLTLNAIQAMPGGGEIILSGAQRSGEIMLSVQDQGSGIADEDLDKIFDPFYTTKASGTGLGLSVAHQIVTQHRGSIQVSKNDGPGMKVTVVLPVKHD